MGVVEKYERKPFFVVMPFAHAEAEALKQYRRAHRITDIILGLLSGAMVALALLAWRIF